MLSILHHPVIAGIELPKMEKKADSGDRFIGMRIISIPELEDLGWFPNVLRRYQTDFLSKLSQAIDLYGAVEKFMFEKGIAGKNIIDLAAGSGAPSIQATTLLRSKGAALTLTDKFPPINFKPAQQTIGLKYSKVPLDIGIDTLPRADLYLMFNSLHHFTISEIEHLLVQIDKNSGSCLFVEPLQPTLMVFIKVLLSTLLGPIFLVPFIRPFKLSRLILTYLIPVGIIVTVWDGLLSVIKSYSMENLKHLQKKMEGKGIRMETGILKGRFNRLSYIYKL